MFDDQQQSHDKSSVLYTFRDVQNSQHSDKANLKQLHSKHTIAARRSVKEPERHRTGDRVQRQLSGRLRRGISLLTDFLIISSNAKQQQIIKAQS